MLITVNDLETQAKRPAAHQKAHTAKAKDHAALRCGCGELGFYVHRAGGLSPRFEDTFEEEEKKFRTEIHLCI